MASMGIPARSHPVAAEWRIVWAPRVAGGTTPARSNALRAIALTTPDPLLVDARARGCNVGMERIAHILGKRQERVATRLAIDPQECAVPIDVGEPQSNNITGAQRQSRQQQESRPIARACGCGGVPGLDRALDVFDGNVAWQGRQGPCGDARNGTDKSRRHVPLEREEAQIHAQGRGQHSRTRSRAAFEMRQHHAPDQRRIIRLGNLSQGGQDRLDLLDVVVDAPGADVSGACEPGAEACEALPVRPEGATPRLDLPGVCEMVQKPWDVGSVAVLVLGASAPADARYARGRVARGARRIRDRCASARRRHLRHRRARDSGPWPASQPTCTSTCASSCRPSTTGSGSARNRMPSRGSQPWGSTP